MVLIPTAPNLRSMSALVKLQPLREGRLAPIRLQMISVACLPGALGKAVFRKNKEERCPSLDVQSSGCRKGFCFRESVQTRGGCPESEEGGAGNPMHGSLPQQVPGQRSG